MGFFEYVIAYKSLKSCGKMMKLKKDTLLLILLGYLSISSILIALLYAYSERQENFLLLKDYAIYFVLLLSLPLYFSYYKLAFLINLIPIVVYLMIAFIYSEVPAYAKLAASRQILTPYVLFYLGYLYIHREQDWARLTKFQTSVLVAVLLFGVFERFSYLWFTVDVKTMFIAKNIPVYANGYPPVFIFPNQIIREAGLNGMVRMVSSYLDPINLGHTLVFGICVILYERSLLLGRQVRWLLAVLFFISVVLTISKGAIFQIFLVFIVLNSRLKPTLRIIFSIASLPILYIFVTGSANFSIHYGGLNSSLANINLFGYGLARVGNYSRMFASDSMLDIGIGDSFWGSLIGQLGVMGFLLWLYPAWRIFRVFPKNHYLGRLLLSQVLISALSENAFNLLSVAFLMVATGAYYSTFGKISRLGRLGLPEEMEGHVTA